MFRLDILSDEYLSDSLNIAISGMLPHENYDPTLFGPILNGVLNYINLEEMYMEYYVLFSSLIQLRKLQVQVEGFEPALTEDVLSSVLESNLYDVVRNPSIRIKEWLLREGHPDNLEIETTLELAVQKLYSRTMDLYRECLSRAVPSNEALSSLPTLKSRFISNVSESSLSVQRDILENGYRYRRKFLVGPEGWLEYITMLKTDLQKRLDASDEGTFHIDSIDKVNEIMEKVKDLYEEMGTYNIPPLDSSTPILKHRLVVISGNEGVGKTTLAIDNATRLIIGGKRVVFMVGESTEALIFAKVLSNYIYHTRDLYVTPEHIANKLEVTEEIDRVIKIASLELQQSKNLILRNSFSYYDFYDQLSNLYETTPFDAVFIDHSKALRGGVEESKDISSLAVQARDFKRDYPVSVFILSHLSTIAKEMISKGKRVDSSPTRGSSTLSGEADEVFVLFKNEKLRERNLIALDVYKTRGPAINDLLILTMKSSVSGYEFDPTNQQTFDRSLVGAEAALRQIEELHDEDEDDEDFISLDDY